MSIKPCRVCEKKPENGYPPSRIQKRDWICTTCSNEQRNRWWAAYRLKKRKARDFEKTNNDILSLTAQLEFIAVMEDTPACPFCAERMKAVRSYQNKGQPLYWTCKSCNDVIKAEHL